MYLPKPFTIEDPDWIARFLADHSFAVLVTQDAEGRMQASHIPLIYQGDGRGGILAGHLARANPQWQDLGSGREAMAIFNGPHRYVSPSWYEGSPNVPTWNYAAVHVYGRPALVAEPEQVKAQQRALVEHYEAGMPTPWQMELPEDYERRMLAGIVAFEITVERIDAKAKLSQNKPASEQARVAEAHAGDGSDDGAALAAMMRGEQRG